MFQKLLQNAMCNIKKEAKLQAGTGLPSYSWDSAQPWQLTSVALSPENNDTLYPS